ncbi:MAG: DMT family transporter [Firmicutes bacterium]|nr:DMT family transporter [Bacillota bacterium]
MREKRWMGYAVLIFITLIWGTTFTVTKNSLLAEMPPLYFLAWRFSLATFGLLLLNLRNLPSMNSVELKGGLVTGGLMAMGFVGQTTGMVYTTATKAGFITGLAVVLVPLAGALLFRRRPSFWVFFAAGLAAVGMGLMSLDFEAGWAINRGDVYLLLSAIAFSFYILYVGLYANRVRVGLLALIKVVITAAVCWLATLLFETQVPMAPIIWWSLLYLAFFATVITTVGQTWGQRVVSPERAALIFALEPVFAAVFAMIFLAERLPPLGVAGSVLIMAGIFLAELAPRKVKAPAME